MSSQLWPAANVNYVCSMPALFN